MIITENAPIEVTIYRSKIDGALVVDVDTVPDTGRVRVNLNDGTIWTGDPEVGDSRTKGNAIFAALANALDDRGEPAAAEWVRDNAGDIALYDYVGKLLDTFKRFADEEK